MDYDETQVGLVWDGYVRVFGRRAFAGGEAHVGELLPYVESSAREVRKFESLGATFGGSRLVELGAGDGRFLARVSQHYGAVDAIDVSREAQDLCRENLAQLGVSNVQLILGGVSAMEEVEPGVDSIVAVYVLQHLPNEECRRFLIVSSRLLEADGVVAVNFASRSLRRMFRDNALGLARLIGQRFFATRVKGTIFELPAFDRPWRWSYVALKDLEAMFDGLPFTLSISRDWRETWVVARTDR